jgi:hypothetical protein
LANLHFHKLPALLLRATGWETIGLIAYVQAAAFVETLLVILRRLVLGILLPTGFFVKFFFPRARGAQF